MSGYTMTMTEVLYSNWGPASTTTPTASAVSMISGIPEIIVPGGFMAVTGRRSSTMRLRMGGLLTATSVIPTFTFGVSYTSAIPGAFSASAVLATSAAITPNAGTNFEWFMDLDIGLRTLTPGAASTVVAMGSIESMAGFPSPNEFTLPTTGTVTGVTAWEADLQYFLWPYVTLSAATAGNTVTVEFVKLYGENLSERELKGHGL
jgi:hypothetical protein